MTQVVRTSDLVFARPDAHEPALLHVRLAVKAGEAVALLGPSGAGKTTLMTLLDGRLRGWTGAVSVLGRTLDPDRAPPVAARPDVGYIFQEFALVERSTAMRNVLNGRLGRMPGLSAFLGLFSARDMEVARKAMEDCGIADLAERRVDSLSGGQRQRVAIARCLAQEPRLILADEPVSNLDPARASEVLSLITKVASDRGATTIFSSHQPDLAQRFATRVLGLSRGRIVFDHVKGMATREDIAALYRDELQEPERVASLRVVQ